MTSTIQQRSATIIAFPSGGRAGLYRAQTAELAAIASSKRAANVAWDAWYHDEAIDADGKTKQ